MDFKKYWIYNYDYTSIIVDCLWDSEAWVPVTETYTVLTDDGNKPLVGEGHRTAWHLRVLDGVIPDFI